ncbi:MAG: hypothetical protein AB1512_15485 [Thermodesulfobacteriota bacterium]
MELKSIRDLKKEDLDRVEEVLFNASWNFEPWADMMFLGGAGGNPGTDSFPLDLDQVERIDITVGGEGGRQHSISVS